MNKQSKTWCTLSAVAGIISLLAGIGGNPIAAGLAGLSAGLLAAPPSSSPGATHETVSQPDRSGATARRHQRCPRTIQAAGAGRVYRQHPRVERADHRVFPRMRGWSQLCMVVYFSAERIPTGHRLTGVWATLLSAPRECGDDLGHDMRKPCTWRGQVTEKPRERLLRE